MNPDSSRIWPFVIAVIAVYAIYKRLRRTFGRQRLRPVRMGLRIAILAALACSLVPLALGSVDFLIAEVAGTALGIALGIWGSSRTRFMTYNGELHYLPHTYTGMAVSLLFLGRLVYRVVQVYAGGAAPGASMVQSPMTVGLFFVLIGYYLCFCSIVLWKSKHLEAEDIEVPSAASPEKLISPEKSPQSSSAP
jgi:hypothetical protein